MRKETIITIQDREQELTFKIREMPVAQRETWLGRALLLAADSTMQIPNITSLSEAGEFIAK